MYRAVAWRALDAGVALDRPRRRSLAAAAGSTLDGGADESTATTSPSHPHPDDRHGRAAVARNPRVREVLVERQRAIGEDGGVVMEGRDIGTVVFPPPR